MAIQLYTPHNKDLSRVKLIGMAIEYGTKAIDLLQEVYGTFPDLASRRQRDESAKIIRAINDILGVSGNFRNGCFYRQRGLSERSETGQVLDHAIPVIHIVRNYIDGSASGYVKAALHPVVRITKDANAQLNRAGRAQSGQRDGYPLSRYLGLDPEIKVVTHDGEPVDTDTWTDDNHWGLVARTAKETPELKEIIDHFKIKLGRD
jgi:hypothetical protein